MDASLIHLFKELVIVAIVDVNSNEHRPRGVERLLQYGADLIRRLNHEAARSEEHQEKTYSALTSILRGEHPVGRVARHVTTAMLCCSRPEAWEAIERLLLAAQRQEGLRQVVLETIDFAHPQAFIRMLRLIEHEKLSRLAA